MTYAANTTVSIDKTQGEIQGTLTIRADCTRQAVA